ncbi:MAG: hypothetical protein MI673_01935, partial [Thiotrichales bacterium]|nr:hypothetical protein [Thiotrichales bacterium]
LQDTGQRAGAHRLLELGLRHPLPKRPDIIPYLEELIRLRQAAGFPDQADQLRRQLASMHRAGIRREKTGDL